jgi:hypothetical protein
VAKIEQIAQSFLGAAAANPQQKHEICRQAAYAFMGMAQDPKNVRASQQLAEVGLQFARASADTRPPVMDDFADLLQETQQAYEAAGPYGDDPMDLIAMRREIHEDRTPRTPGQIFITPESFNRDATLGRSAKIKFAPTEDDKRNGIQQSQTVAFWQGTKKEAQAMTVDVNLIFLPGLPAAPDLFTPLNARPYFELEYGSDGNKTKVVADLALGKRATVPGNYVAVNVGMDPPGFGKPCPVIDVGASIGAFAATSPAPLVRTVYADSVPTPGSSVAFPIPLKAVALLPVQSTLVVGESFRINFLDFGGGAISRVFYTQAANATMPVIPIIGDASFVVIEPTGAFLFPTNAFRLPFQLAL